MLLYLTVCLIITCTHGTSVNNTVGMIDNHTEISLQHFVVSKTSFQRHFIDNRTKTFLKRKVENDTQNVLKRSHYAHLLSQTQTLEDEADRLVTDMEDRILKYSHFPNLPNSLGEVVNIDRMEEETNTSTVIPENTKEKYDVTEIEVNQAAHVAGYLFSGDMRLTKEQEDGFIRQLLNDNHYKYNYDYEVNGNVKFWPGGIVPYTFAPNFNLEGRDIVYSAISEFREKTCINFVHRKNETNYVNFFHGRGCWSWLGNTGIGEQKVSLQRGSCLNKGIAMHEMMHVLGCGHEHVRTDRDDYIRIEWDNIRPAFTENFQIQKKYKLSKKYDYLSITHYPQSAFAKHQYDYTITLKGNGKSALIGQRRQLSELDALSLNNIYCDDTNSIKSIKRYQNRTNHDINDAWNLITKR